MEQFYFFLHGFLSNWHPCSFIVRDISYAKLTYNCTEQYMMAQKALMFNDHNSYIKIMNSKSPRDQKAIGRSVKNFLREEWDFSAKDIVFEGCLAKFLQNPDLKEQLLEIKGTIVEASPYDQIWGIGLSQDDPRALDRKTWRGLNWLGEVLMKVRDHIIESKASGRL